MSLMSAVSVRHADVVDAKLIVHCCQHYNDKRMAGLESLGNHLTFKDLFTCGLCKVNTTKPVYCPHGDIICEVSGNFENEAKFELERNKGQ